MNPCIYYTKVDWWLAALIGGVLAVDVASVAVVVVGLIMSAVVLESALVTFAILISSAIIMGLVLWACYNTRYEITPTDLRVHFGPFCTTLPLDTLVEVFPTHNPLSAPAPSLDRLRINYRRKNGKMWFTLISPKDKEGFVRDLASAAPQLRSAGDGFLRLKAGEPA